MPFAGFENFETCITAQRGKGKTEESARRICGALQAQTEGKSGKSKSTDVEVADEDLVKAADALDDETIEIMTEGQLAEVIRENAIEPPDDPNAQPVIEEIFITDDDQIVSSKDVMQKMFRTSMKGFDSDQIVKDMEATSENLEKIKMEMAKTAKGTTQSPAELGGSRFDSDLSGVQLVEPPYPPELLATFLEVEETHFRCVRTKVTDSVGRDFEILPRVTVKPEEPKTKPLTPKGADGLPGKTSKGAKGEEVEGEKANSNGAVGNGMAEKAKAVLQKVANMAGMRGRPQTTRKKDVTQDEIDAETQIVEDFIEDANDVLGFEGVLDRAAMDYEGIGWGALEVIRSKDKQVRRIAHAPASRMRVLKNWKGFVEIIDSAGLGNNGASLEPGRFVYYQPFGEKVKSKTIDPLTGEKENYDPVKHGKLDPSKLEWNLIDRETGKPTGDITKAANEIIWIPRHHSNTIYYGYADVVPALGWLLANVHIRDYVLQFFEHNTVPRYAIIIEGAKLAEPVKKAITQYFSSHVKGKAHKTLIIPVPSMRGEVRIRFEKLDADAQESSFQDTKKNNAQSIMTSHGVSPAIIGISEHSELGSGKGLSQAEIYKDRIVSPNQRYWARKLNKMFKTGLGVQLVALKFNPLDIRDMDAEMKVLAGYLDHGVLTINQVRKKAGLGEPIPGGDRAFILAPSGVMFVDEMTEAMGEEREKLEMEIEETKGQMAAKALEVNTQQQTERMLSDNKLTQVKLGAKNGSGGNSGTKPPAGKPNPKAGKASSR